MKNYEFVFTKDGVFGTIVLPADSFYDAVQMYNMVFPTIKVIRVMCKEEPNSPVVAW